MEVTIEDAMRPEAVAAFVGTAVSMEDIGYTEGHDDEYWGPLRWTFEVETVLLGEIHETVVVGSGCNSADCGIDFEHLGRVGIVAYEDGKGSSTGLCSGVWDADHLIAVHGPGSTPLPGAPETAAGGIPIWVWPAVLLATGAVGTMSADKNG